MQTRNERGCRAVIKSQHYFEMQTLLSAFLINSLKPMARHCIYYVLAALKKRQTMPQTYKVSCLKKQSGTYSSFRMPLAVIIYSLRTSTVTRVSVPKIGFSRINCWLSGTSRSRILGSSSIFASSFLLIPSNCRLSVPRESSPKAL